MRSVTKRRIPELQDPRRSSATTLGRTGCRALRNVQSSYPPSAALVPILFEKLQNAFTPDSCKEVVQSTIPSSKRVRIDEKARGRAEEHVAYPSMSEKQRRR